MLGSPYSERDKAMTDMQWNLVIRLGLFALIVISANLYAAMGA